MRLLVVSLLVLCGLSGNVFADDAVLNDAPAALSVLKQAIDKLDPQYETVYDVLNGGFTQGISGSLYDFTSNEIHVASLRAGVATGVAAYAGVSLDLPGLTKRLLPDAVESIGSTAPLNAVWSVVGRYARVGVVGGFSWDHEDPMIGITAGAALTF